MTPTFFPPSSASTSSGMFGAKETGSSSDSHPALSHTENSSFSFSFPSMAGGTCGTTLNTNSTSTFPSGGCGVSGTTTNFNSSSSFSSSGNPSFSFLFPPMTCGTSGTTFNTNSTSTFASSGGNATPGSYGVNGTIFNPNSVSSFAGSGGAFGNPVKSFNNNSTSAFGPSSCCCSMLRGNSRLYSDLPSAQQPTVSPFGPCSTPCFGVSSNGAFSSPSLATPGFPFSSAPSTFGSQTSPFGSQTALFGSQTSPFGSQTSPFYSTTTSGPAFRDSSASFSTQGFRQPLAIDQGKGSRLVPYSPTHDHNGGGLASDQIASISAMVVYRGKSHEELRLEDYQQRSIDNLCSASPKITSPVVKSDNSNHLPPQGSSSLFGQHLLGGDSSGFGFTPSKLTNVSEGGKLSAGPPTPIHKDKPDRGGISCRCKDPSQDTNVGSSAQPSGPGVAYGAFLPVFVNYLAPAFGALGLSHASFAAQPFKPESGVPALVTYAPALLMPAFGTQVSSVTEAFGSTYTSLFGLNVPNGAPSSTTPLTSPATEAPSNSRTYGDCISERKPSSFGFSKGMSAALCGLNEIKTTPKMSSGIVTNQEPAAAAGGDQESKEKEGDSFVANSLKVIVEKLGLDPWANGRPGKETAGDYPHGWILACEEAERDADILALAEFAVEQHNAIDKDGKLSFVKVVGAWLEPVSGGRYHIVLDANDANALTFSNPRKRYYASVLRNSSHLAVLEKWLPGKV